MRALSSGEGRRRKKATWRWRSGGGWSGWRALGAEQLGNLRQDARGASGDHEIGETKPERVGQSVNVEATCPCEKAKCRFGLADRPRRGGYEYKVDGW
jgi:hypothetical protein